MAEPTPYNHPDPKVDPINVDWTTADELDTIATRTPILRHLLALAGYVEVAS